MEKTLLKGLGFEGQWFLIMVISLILTSYETTIQSMPSK